MVRSNPNYNYCHWRYKICLCPGRVLNLILADIKKSLKSLFLNDILRGVCEQCNTLDPTHIHTYYGIPQVFVCTHKFPAGLTCISVKL